MKKETVYQTKLIKTLEKLLPGCFIMKNDPAETQGIPDLLILFRKRWAMLETKASSKAPKQPNQDYYVKKFGQMSFASFINPQNEEQVLGDLQSALRVSRSSRLP